MNAEAITYFPNALSDARPQEVLAPDDVSITDQVLLVEIAKGSKDALGLLFERHARAVRNVAWRILRDEPEADDLRQDVFLYVFERASSYDPTKSTPASWIIQIAYHRAIDRRRYLEHRHHYQATDVAEELQLGVESRHISPDHLDGKAVLKEMENQLSSDQRKTLELHIVEGYSFKEIADRTGQTLGNVRHQYYRAIERLRTKLFTRAK